MLMRRYGKGIFWISFQLRFQNDVLLTKQIFVVYKWMSHKHLVDAGDRIASRSEKGKV
jgi:hypothetical protein